MPQSTARSSNRSNVRPCGRSVGATISQSSAICRRELADRRPRQGKAELVEGDVSMLQKMTAEICFPGPNELNRASAELIELDFDIELIDDWIDDDGPAIWIDASVLTELDAGGFLDWVRALVGPFDGFVVDAGPSSLMSSRPNRIGSRPG